MMKYLIWVKDLKKTTIRQFDIPPYSKDGSPPTMIKIKGVACKSVFFNWSDYSKIRYERIPTKEDP